MLLSTRKVHGVSRVRSRTGTTAVASSRGAAPVVALVALNVSSALVAGLVLARSDGLPSAIALHGAMMIAAWGCLLPLGGLVARYFKVTPEQDYPAVVDNPFWWTWHRILQYSGVTLATAALIVIIRDIGGRFDTLHGRCGLVVVTLAALQVASPLFRGSKGGPTERGATIDDPLTWRGDHYDMTPRRRLFEAWHKLIGWCLLALAQATMLLGALLAGGSDWLLGVLGVMTASVVLGIVDCHLRGRWVDTHAALWGPDASPRRSAGQASDSGEVPTG